MSMATKMLLSREEYLQTSFENPEPDYVDGELMERPIPNFSHGRTQVLLSDAFMPCEKRKELFRAPEIRFPVALNKFRVADFGLFTRPQRDLPEDAPYMVVEIVSPDDRHEELITKLAEYEDAGIKFIFLADPPLRKLSRYQRGDLINVPALEMPEYGVNIPLSQIFE